MVTIQKARPRDAHRLHSICLPGDVHEDYRKGFWLAALDGPTPVAFAGIRACDNEPHLAYFSRVGVLPSHRGRGLQARLMKALERQARSAGFEAIVSTTYCNPVSGNNFIRLGYRLYEPTSPWGAEGTCYWIKNL